MGFFSFLFKVGAFVAFVKWISGRRGGRNNDSRRMHIKYTPSQKNPTARNGPKILFQQSPNSEPVDILNGLVIDTPFFKFNSDGDGSATATATASSSSTTTAEPVSVEINATPKILASGRVSFEIDLPGFAKEDVELSYNSDENVIELKGTRKGSESSGRTERRVDAKIPVPPEADVGDIHAAMEHGVLKIDLGKRVVSGRPVVIE